MMETVELIDVLNDLIRINKDRIEGYEKAIAELQGQDTGPSSHPSFEDRITESRVFVNELSGAVARLGGQPQQQGTASGTLYRLWMDLKTTFTGSTNKSVLELCEYGEDVALKAYNKALKERSNWPEETHDMLKRQREILDEAHNLIKRYRDELKRVNV